MDFSVNFWDFIYIIMLLCYAIAFGLRDDDGKPQVPKDLIVRSIGLTLIILFIFNIPNIITWLSN